MTQSMQPSPFDALFNAAVVEAIVQLDELQSDIVHVNAALMCARQSLEEQRLDYATGHLLSAAGGMERLSRRGCLFPREYVQRWEVLQFAVSRGFL